MLPTRRAVFRLSQRPYLYQLRSYAGSKPPDPTSTDRQSDQKPVNEPSAVSYSITKSWKRLDAHMLKFEIQGHDSSGTPSTHAASAGGHIPTHHDHHPEPHNEDLGRSFYVSIAALALSFAIYKFSRSSTDAAGDPDKQPLFTRIISSYRYWQDQFAERNTLHTRMVEQAGADRNLFQSSPWTHHIELKFPEIFNTGSPYNVPAGSTVNLDELKAHYQQKNLEAEKKRMARLVATEGDSYDLTQRREAEGAQGG